MTDGQASTTSRVTLWVGVLSSVITIGLTAYNAVVKAEIDRTEIRLKELETSLKVKAQQLEESKERTSRYTFVKTLFPDLIEKDETHKNLTINLIKLSLTPEEAEKLFTGFAKSQNRELQTLGSAGLTVIKGEKDANQLAADKEREGFENLINKNDEAAIAAFAEAEKAVPGYHSVYEITNLLKKEKQNLANTSARKKVIGRIVHEYSWKVPEDLIERLRKAAES